MKNKLICFLIPVLGLIYANDLNGQWEISGNVTIDHVFDMLGTIDDSHIPFRTSNTEWMRLTHTQGWLGLHTTTPLGTFHQHNY